MLRLLAASLFLAACGSEGDPPADAGAPTTRAKFCNFLSRDGASLTLTLEIGTPPIRISAATGTCSAPVGSACTLVPTGDLTVEMLEGNKTLGTLTANFSASAEYVLGARSSPDTGQLVLTRTELTDLRCATIDPAILVLAGTL
jgi:hypothetical protein